MSAEPTGIILRIVELLRANPEGLTSGEIREGLGLAAHEQAQLDRRRRQIRDWYDLIQVPNGASPRYRLGAKRDRSAAPGGVNGRLRAEVLHFARGRCQMCGRTVEADSIKLQVDHKIPREWGGSNDLDNLWALCVECNHGKKDLFSSQDESVKQVMEHKSVHVRIGELLKLNINAWVPSLLLEFVANQDDWMKRTRELRYLGWKYDVTRKKLPNGRSSSLYRLRTFTPWPEDPTKWLRRYEKERANANRIARDA